MGGTAMNTVLRRSIYIILFVVFLALIITGLKEQTLGYLFRMFAGLAGLIVLLWVYNKNHK
jgi:hypothetical protein